MEGDCIGSPDNLSEGESLTNRLLCNFITTYPEFSPVGNDTSLVNRFYSLADKVRCVNNQYQCICDAHLHGCDLLYKYFALLAHYIVVSGVIPQDVIPGLQSPFSNAQRISSVSLGDASINFDNSALTSNLENPTKGWLSITTYGREYLAYLQKSTGFLYIN